MTDMLIWNINQRAGYGDSFYPKILRDCFYKNYGIIIFSEFYKHVGWEGLFYNTKYEYVVSENGIGKNEILIAYDKERYSLEEKFTWQSDYDTFYPDYLDIALKEVKGNIMRVVGTRILVNTYNYNNAESVNKEMKNRAEQGKRIAGRLTNLTEKKYRIIGGGDLNTGRRYNRNKYWTYGIFSGELPKEMEVKLPKGVSHEAYKGEYAGCPDLVFYTKNIANNVNVRPYDWEFVKECKEVYNVGEMTKKIPVCYPDHAQILVDFNMEKCSC